MSTTDVKVNWQTVRHQVSIAGIVQDSKTKQAIAGARVEIGNLKNTHSQTWTLTGVDGWFYFLDLPPNTAGYTLSAWLPNEDTPLSNASISLIKIPKLDKSKSSPTPADKAEAQGEKLAASSAPRRASRRGTKSKKQEPTVEES